jgi:hypothetical protein
VLHWDFGCAEEQLLVIFEVRLPVRNTSQNLAKVSVYRRIIIDDKNPVIRFYGLC